MASAKQFPVYQAGLPAAALRASFQERWGATLAPTSSRHAEADAFRGYACCAFGKGHHTLA